VDGLGGDASRAVVSGRVRSDTAEDGLLVLLGRKEIECHLQIEPKVRRGIEVFGQPQGRAWGHTPAAAHNLIHSLEWNMDGFRQFALADA
jgi:hypothetical protein